MPDEELVARVRGGDEKAFEALVRRHIRGVLDVAESIVAGVADAEDACQEAFILALTRIDQCRQPERFRSWLLVIVRNQALRMLDTRPNGPDVISELERVCAPAPADPFTEAQRSEIRSDVAEALEGLTELQRSVLMLHDLEGWSHPDIGRRLGISAGSSRVHLHVARRTMRKRLGPRYAEIPT